MVHLVVFVSSVGSHVLAANMCSTQDFHPVILNNFYEK